MLQRSGVDFDVLVSVRVEYVDVDVVLGVTLGFCCLPRFQRLEFAKTDLLRMMRLGAMEDRQSIRLRGKTIVGAESIP